MEPARGKWVPLNQYARRRRISKSTIYRKIRNAELTKRVGETGAEVFLVGDELDKFENSNLETPGEPAAATPMGLDTDLDADDAFSIADQTLKTMIAMHKEVMAEKSRLLEEWESELRLREERVEQLSAALAGKDAIVGERTAELRELKRALRSRDELLKEHERSLAEYRRMVEQREEIDHLADSTREELTAALDEKDKLLSQKERIIEEQRKTLSQREDVYRSNTRAAAELKQMLADANALLGEKDEMIQRLKSEPGSASESSKDQTIAELKALIQTLEGQLEMKAKAQELTGFSEKGPETGTLIQEQLEYLMESESTEKYASQGIPPVETPPGAMPLSHNSEEGKNE